MRTILILVFILISHPLFALETPFKVGEKFTYEVKLFGFKIGSQINEVISMERINNQETYHLSSTIKSNPFFLRYYELSEQIDSWVGTSSLLPIQIIKDVETKKYHKSYLFLLDNVNQKATITSKHAKTTKQVDIFPKTLDPLSLIYYLRNQELKVGNSYDLSILSDNGVKQIKVNIVKEEKVSTPYGKLVTLKAEQSDSDIIVWLTKDKFHIPVKIEIEIEIGRLKADLCKKEE